MRKRLTARMPTLMRRSAADLAVIGGSLPWKTRPSAASAARLCCELRRIAVPLDRDVGERLVDLAQIVCAQFQARGRHVFLQAFDFGRARNGDNPWLLLQQPGERDLRRRGLLCYGNRCQPSHQGLVGAAGLRREAWQRVAEVVLGEGRAGVDLAGEESSAERAERHEADGELFAKRQDVRLGLPPPQ